MLVKSVLCATKCQVFSHSPHTAMCCTYKTSEEIVPSHDWVVKK